MQHSANVYPVDSRVTISERLARLAEESPTLRQILDGVATIRRISDEESLARRDDGVLCRVSTHEITFPGHKSDGSDWVTYLSHWEPIPAEYGDPYRQPENTLTILTGSGTMPYSGDHEVNRAILGEMRRQESGATFLPGTQLEK